MSRSVWAVALGVLVLAGCKSEGKKATEECLSQTDLMDRAEKCVFACSVYNSDESSKESCPAASDVMKAQCFQSADGKNASRCKDICRGTKDWHPPADVRKGCDELLKY